MAIGTFIHHIGTVLLLAATVLLVIASISAPVVNNISILHAEILGNNEISYGTFGYCIRGVGDENDSCTSSRVGYSAYDPIVAVGGAEIGISNAREATIRALTHVMVLHPVGAGLAFIAMLLCIGTNVVGSFLATLVAGLAFIVTLVVLVCDFVAFGLLRDRIRDSTAPNTTASYGTAIWCVLAAAICILIATVVVFVTCCAGRRKHRREREARKTEPETWNGAPPPRTYPQRRRRWAFWQRRRGVY